VLPPAAGAIVAAADAQQPGSLGPSYTGTTVVGEPAGATQQVVAGSTAVGEAAWHLSQLQLPAAALQQPMSQVQVAAADVQQAQAIAPQPQWPVQDRGSPAVLAPGGLQLVQQYVPPQYTPQLQLVTQAGWQPHGSDFGHGQRQQPLPSLAPAPQHQQGQRMNPAMLQDATPSNVWQLAQPSQMAAAAARVNVDPSAGDSSSATLLGAGFGPAAAATGAASLARAGSAPTGAADARPGGWDALRGHPLGFHVPDARGGARCGCDGPSRPRAVPAATGKLIRVCGFQPHRQR